MQTGEKNLSQPSAKTATEMPSARQPSLLPGEWEQAALAMLGQGAQVLGAEVTPSQYDAYLRLLRDLPLADLYMALDRCLRESVYWPRPAEILAAAGRSPEAMAQRALNEVLLWADEWGPKGSRHGAVGYERITRADGTTVIRILKPNGAHAPRLPERTERALCAMAGSRKRAIERLLECEAEPERYAHFRREFIAAWREW